MRCPSEFAAILLLLLLAGCQNVAAPEQTPQAGTIKLGVIGIMGRDTSTRSYAGGAQLAAQEINARGGVLGRPLEILVNADIPGSLEGPQGARTLVDQGCIGLIGPAYSSGVIETYNAVCVPRSVPLISFAATSPAISTLPGAGDLVWRTAASDAFQGVVLANQARALGLARVSVLFRDDAYGGPLAATFTARFLAQGGTVLASISYPPNSTLVGPYVAQAMAAGVPDAFVLVADELEGAALLRQFQLQDPQPKPVFLGVDAMYGPSFLANIPATYAEGMFGTTAAAPAGDPAYEGFLSAFRATIGSDPIPWTEGAYDAVYLMALAMTRGQATSPGVLRANLRTVSGGLGTSATKVGPQQYAAAVSLLQAGQMVDYDGASGAIDWDAHGDVTSATYLWWRLTNGAFVTQARIKVP